jgi:predicted YcjX-like family ATPase
MTIDEFREAVMSLRPNNFMALNGAASGILGSSDSGTDAILQLQRTVIEFVDRYKQGSDEEIMNLRREVIGKIMVAMALDAITEEKADELTEAVMQITKGKN